MNRITRAPHCLICRFDLKTALAQAALVAERAELARQIENGICDPCTRMRLTAALEYQAAKNQVALFTALGAMGGRPNSAATQAGHRLRVAEAQCVRLQMWAGNREEHH